jgi:hypothetical protein
MAIEHAKPWPWTYNVTVIQLLRTVATELPVTLGARFVPGKSIASGISAILVSRVLDPANSGGFYARDDRSRLMFLSTISPGVRREIPGYLDDGLAVAATGDGDGY